MRIIWRESAKLDLLEIADHIGRDSPRAAQSVVRALRQSAAKLAPHPRIGRPGRVEGTRELVNSRFPSYITVYQIDPDAVRILAVVNTARLWPLEF